MSFCLAQLTPTQKNIILNKHNFYRQVVGTKPLQWSKDLENKAQQWALQIVNHPLITHNPFGLGQNLFYTADTSELTIAVDFWAREQIFYYGQIVNDTNVIYFRHYTNIIWKDTQYVGCAVAQLKSGIYVLVCFYSPKGNIIGQSAIR